jgi:hypothetical protein
MRRVISISGLLELRSYQSLPASVPTGGIFGLKQTPGALQKRFGELKDEVTGGWSANHK